MRNREQAWSDPRPLHHKITQVAQLHHKLHHKTAPQIWWLVVGLPLLSLLSQLVHLALFACMLYCHLRRGGYGYTKMAMKIFVLAILNFTVLVTVASGDGAAAATSTVSEAECRSWGFDQPSCDTCALLSSDTPGALAPLDLESL